MIRNQEVKVRFGFGSTGRAGINYDEFGDGCMHKASSENIPENIDVPIWLKLVRHGNSFTGTLVTMVKTGKLKGDK